MELEFLRSRSILSKRQRRSPSVENEGTHVNFDLNPWVPSESVVPFFNSKHPFYKLLRRFLFHRSYLTDQHRCVPLALGADQVYKKILKNKILGVVLAHKVKPPKLVEHIIAYCQKNNIPILYLSNIRKLTYDALDYECITLGLVGVRACKEVIAMMKILCTKVETQGLNIEEPLPKTSRPILRVQPLTHGQLEPLPPADPELTEAFLPLQETELLPLDDTPLVHEQETQQTSEEENVNSDSKTLASGSKEKTVRRETRRTKKDNNAAATININAEVQGRGEESVTSSTQTKKETTVCKFSKISPGIFQFEIPLKPTDRIQRKILNMANKLSSQGRKGNKSDESRRDLVKCRKMALRKRKNLTQFGFKVQDYQISDPVPKKKGRKNSTAEDFIPLAGSSKTGGVQSDSVTKIGKRKLKSTTNEDFIYSFGNSKNTGSIQNKRNLKRATDKSDEEIPKAKVKRLADKTPNPARAGKRKRSQE